eukprot:3957230-Alexandrium_andersonii.AAC.1
MPDVRASRSSRADFRSSRFSGMGVRSSLFVRGFPVVALVQVGPRDAAPNLKSCGSEMHVVACVEGCRESADQGRGPGLLCAAGDAVA